MKPKFGHNSFVGRLSSLCKNMLNNYLGMHSCLGLGLPLFVYRHETKGVW